MGIFLFIKDAGAKIFGIDKTPKKRITLVATDVFDVQNLDIKILKDTATANNNMAMATEAPKAQFYTVVKGNYLSKIVKKIYDNVIKYSLIFDTDKPMLTHPDKIYQGQVLKIPTLS